MDGSGHSLGGSIYEAAASFWGLRGMNIDGPGVAKQIASPEFQAIKEEFRARGLTDLRDSYEWQQGDFQARRYTVVGAAEIHAGGVDVYTSPRMGALIDDMNATPSWAYALGAGSKFAWETVASVAGHPMAAIFGVEGYGNVEAALEQQRVLANVAQGLSASGYEAGSVHYQALGTPVVVGVDSTASSRQDMLQISTYKDEATGAIMEVRLIGRRVDGQFEAGIASASISGMDSAGRVVLVGEAASALAKAQLRTQASDASGDASVTVSAGSLYDRASIQQHANGATSYEFVREGGDRTWVLENPETRARTVVVSVSNHDTSDGSTPDGPRTLVYELDARGGQTGQPRYYDEAGHEVDHGGHPLHVSQGESTPAAGATPQASAFEKALIAAFETGQIAAGPGSLYAMTTLGIVSDAGGAAEPIAPGPHSFARFAEGAGSGLGIAQMESLARQLDVLHLGDPATLSFITLPGGATLIQNADGDVVGEIQQPGADGRVRVSATRIDADGNVQPVALHIDAQGQALDDRQVAQAQAQQAAAAIGLLNSIVGLQDWDAMSDLQRTAAIAGVHNAVDRVTGGALPGDLGTAAGVLGLLAALDRGDAGSIVYSGLSLVESLTATTTVNAAGQTIGSAGMVTDTLGGNFLPALGLVLAIDSGDPWAMASSSVALMTALQVIPVWGQLLAVAIAFMGTVFAQDVPMREGIAHAEWDAQGHAVVVTDLDAEGGGETATRWMQGLLDGLQTRLSGSGHALVPNLLPAIGFQYDPDGFNLRNGATGYMILRWTDEDGTLQTRHYDGAGQRGDGSGETLAGDFMKHAARAIAPAWVVETALAHWRQGDGLSLPDALDGLPRAMADGLRQSIEAVTIALPGEAATRRASIDVDGDGYLESTQWVGADRQLLSIDADGDGRIGAGELLDLGEGRSLHSAGWLDANGDGVLDASDPAFSALRLWLDVNGDGLSTGESRTLAQAGITAIDFAGDSPVIVRSDGSREALTTQTLTAGTLGVASQRVAGGVLQIVEQADGSGTALLVAENQRLLDGQESHMHGGDLDTDGGRDVVDARDGRLQGSSARTLDGAFVRTTSRLDDGDARIRAGSAGAATAGQGVGRREASPDSATVRSNGIIFVPVAAQNAVAEAREVTGVMVRSAQSGVSGDGLGPNALTLVALGAVAQWPVVADAADDVAMAAPGDAPGMAVQASVVPDVDVPTSADRPSSPARASFDGPGPMDFAHPRSNEAIGSPLHADAGRNRDMTPPSGAGMPSMHDATSTSDPVIDRARGSPSSGSPSLSSLPPLSSVATMPMDGVAAQPSVVMVDHPSVGDEKARGLEDTTLRFTEAPLLANDATRNSPPAGRQALTITSVLAPRHGQVSLQGVSGVMEIVFVPEPGYHGPASFSYTVSDAYGLSRTAVVLLDVGAVNDAPLTRGESASGTEDRALLFSAGSLLANDSDADTAVDGDMLRITRVGAAEHGRVFLLSDGTVRFEPDADYNGPARFSYWVGDRDMAGTASGEGLETEAFVQLVVDAVNDAPRTRNENAKSTEDQALWFTSASLLTNDSDADTALNGDVLRITRVGAAEHGRVFLLPDGSVRFEPDDDYNGPARFSYWVGDRDPSMIANGEGSETEASVDLFVTAVNDAPQTRNEVATGDEDSALLFTAASLMANDSDADTALNGDVLRITRVGAAEHGQVFLLPEGTVRFEPDADYNGPARFSYWVGDRDASTMAGGAGFETQASVALTILAVNDLPVVVDEQLDSREDTVLHIDPGLLLANDGDVDVETNAQALRITAVGDAQHGTVTLLPDGSIRFEPQQDYAGAAGFSYTVDDGYGGRAIARAVVNLAPVNDAPVVTGEDIAFDEDAIQNFSSASLLANDRDVDDPQAMLRIVSVGNASHGAVSMDADGAIRFVPQQDYFGDASFTYTVADGAGGFTVGTASLRIAPVNDAPRLIGEAVRLDEDTVATFSATTLLTNDGDVDDPHAGLRIVSVGAATHGSVAMIDGAVLFTPDANFNGQAGFTYTVADGSGGTSEATVTLEFALVNDAPVANDELLWGKRDVAYTLTQAALLANDLDVESPGDLRISSIGNARHGQATLQADGSVTFIPDAGYAGRGSFTYVVQDPEGATSTATAQIDFSRVNVNPTATDDSFIGYEDIALTVTSAQLLVNDLDPDDAASALRVTAVAGAVNGVVGMDAAGSVTFVPASNFNGSASFRYQVSDPEGGQTWATAYVDVQPVNDAPVVEDIWYGRPIYGYRWQPTGNFRTPFDMVAVEDEATAIALASDPSDTIRNNVGNAVKNNDLMDAHGNAIGVSYYLNGHLRPTSFDNRDGTQPPRLGPSPVDVPVRQNGGIVVFDPDGDSNAVTYRIGATPQHGLAWTGQYIPSTVSGSIDHTGVKTWIAQTGTWQYYSFRGDEYTGSDPFTIVATDAQGASSSATIAAHHFGTSASGGGSCPIVIDLQRDGIELLRPEDSNFFADVNGDGWRDRIGWAAPSDGVLAFDQNDDGQVDLDSEVSFVPYVPQARTDLEGLAAFDTDGDGWITSNDARWKSLGVLQDRNGNGQQDAGEFALLSDRGISGIDLHRQGEPAMNQGNVVFGTSTVRWADGHVSTAADVMFAGEGIALPAEIDTLFPASRQEAELAAVERLARLFNQAVNTASVASDDAALAYVPPGAGSDIEPEDMASQLSALLRDASTRESMASAQSPA